MRNLILTLLSLHLLGLNLIAQTINPDDFFPNELGEHFMPHHTIVSYFEAVGEKSNQAQFAKYGETYEGRDLIYMVISSPENMRDIETLRKSNLDIVNGENKSLEDSKAIVWLSFGVHGNEAGATNSSIATLYELTDPNNTEVQSWLENTIVIIDPCLNPDGYDRYVQWNRGVGNREPNPHIETREHHEPWPSGRVNHYQFDLNRDWAWATQVETQQRLKIYNQWLPHIHADVHEQGHNDHYYFAPAAKPYHKYITDWQGDFQTEIGKNHTKYFDSEGWLYFTREVFDLLYPSYGDTYPTFRGAVGMTYEQAGHGISGRAILMNNGDTLMLSDRILHHKTAALSTVEVTSRAKDRVVDNFKQYYQNKGKTPGSNYKSFVLKNDETSKNKIHQLTKLLDVHGIAYGYAGVNSSVSGFDYQKMKQGSVNIDEDDLVVNTNQSMSTLIEVLFEPRTEITDSLTYDITAWSLPYAFGLEGVANKQTMNFKKAYEYMLDKPVESSATKKKPYAYMIPWNSVASAKLLSEILQAGITVRTAWKPFELEGRKMKEGTLIVTQGDNEFVDFREKVKSIAAKHEMELYPAYTGFVNNGSDFGSGNVKLVKASKIALVNSESVNQNAYGHLWHFFEQELNYPISNVSAENLGFGDLSKYDVIILPNGFYQDLPMKEIDAWVKAGGKLIALEGAINSIQKMDNIGLKVKKSDKKMTDSKASRLRVYGQEERSGLSRHLPGAIVKLHIDQTHPLGFGMGDTYFTMKTNRTAYEYLENGWNVGYLKSKVESSGFIGHKVKSDLAESVCIGTINRGRGQIVMLTDNPVYRGFWKQGGFLLSNAVFLLN